MSELTLLSDNDLDITALSNIYIDEYMFKNNESQIKIYLFLLRNLSKGAPVSVITIADTFNYSIMDVERALFYMEKQGLMSLKVDNECIVGLRLLPLRKKRADAYKENLKIDGFRLVEVPKENGMNCDVIIPSKPEYTKDDLSLFKANDKIEELLFVVQAYTGKPLTVSDLKSLKYINEELSFSVDLIEYLVESSVERNKKSFSYMEKVAIDWFSNGIDSVESAKNATNSIPKELESVFTSFGINIGKRKPSEKEKAFVLKWFNQYGFSKQIVDRACNITLDRTHSVSFEYADAILTDWNKKGVKSLKDIEELSNKNTQGGSEATATNKKASKKQGAGSFNNFSAREYDFAQLEKELLRN